MSENTAPTLDPEYMGPPRTAVLVDRSVAALAMDRSRGVGLPYTRIGNRIRYKRSDVEQYLAARRVVPGEKKAG